MLKLVKPTADDRPAFDRLAQLYAYDFSEMTDLTLGTNGLFPAHECFTKIWTDPNRHPRLFMVDAQLAGFAIVHRIEDGDFDMEQFFVLRNFRRSGVGREAAHSLFREFTGYWTVEQITSNKVAQVFWRGVISEFTNGDYKDTKGEDPVLSFVC